MHYTWGSIFNEGGKEIWRFDKRDFYDPKHETHVRALPQPSPAQPNSCGRTGTREPGRAAAWPGCWARREPGRGGAPGSSAASGPSARAQAPRVLSLGRPPGCLPAVGDAAPRCCACHADAATNGAPAVQGGLEAAGQRDYHQRPVRHNLPHDPCEPIMMHEYAEGRVGGGGGVTWTGRGLPSSRGEGRGRGSLWRLSGSGGGCTAARRLPELAARPGRLSRRPPSVQTMNLGIGNLPGDLE